VELRIAIVDDDPSICDAVKLILKSEGWEVATYLTGESFIDDLVRGKVPDCAILDPHLSGMNGADVAVQMQLKSPHIPYIGMTARPESRITARLAELGARCVLTKPVSAQDLIDQIKRICLEVDR